MASPVYIQFSDPRVTAFRWMVDWLQKNVQGVDEWYLNDDETGYSLGVPENISTISYVLVVLTPIWEEERPDSAYGGSGYQQIVRAPVLVRIEARTSGANADNSGAMAGMLEACSGIGSAADEQDAADAGISWVEWVQAPMLAGLNSMAKGAIRLMVHLVR